MKHQSSKQRDMNNQYFAIANIVGLIRKNDIKGAIATAEIAKINPQQFGIIAKYADKESESINDLTIEIYKAINK